MISKEEKKKIAHNIAAVHALSFIQFEVENEEDPYEKFALAGNPRKAFDAYKSAFEYYMQYADEEYSSFK